MNCLFQMPRRHKKAGSMPCDKKIYPTETQWLHSGWKPNARKRKTGNSEITPFPVSQQVTRTGFEKAGIFLLLSSSVRESPKTNDLIKTNIY